MLRYIFLGLCIICISFVSLSGYYLTNDDETILDNFEEKLFALIDDSSRSITPERVLDYTYYLLDNRELSERQRVLLEIIADDISYYYYLGEYADDVYEMLPEDCYDDEYYDAEDKWCYFKDENYIDDGEDYLGNEYHSPHEEIESDIIASYMIEGDSIELISGEKGEEDIEIWNIFSTMIPLAARKDFKMYHIINDADSDSGAYVEQDATENSRWNMAVNLSAFYIDDELDVSYVYATLIHEFAHVLTLGPDQMRYYPQTENEVLLDRFAENCDTNLLGEGCLHEEAYLDDFIDTFWPGEEYLEKVRNEEIQAYSGNEDNFVTEYAATNPGEDIAESFTYFILKNKDVGEKISGKKINFFYNYNDLVVLRKQIRFRLSSLR